MKSWQNLLEFIINNKLQSLFTIASIRIVIKFNKKKNLFIFYFSYIFI